jgi:hypothetical protein
VRWIDAGGVPGLAERATNLAAFKQGWTNTTRQTYLCGKMLDPEAYRALSAAAGNPETSYFPAYRWGEFGRQGG